MLLNSDVFQEVCRAVARPVVKDFVRQWADLLKKQVTTHGFESDHNPLWSTETDPDGRIIGRWGRRWGDPLTDTYFYLQADIVLEVVQVLDVFNILQEMLSAKLRIVLEILPSMEYSATYDSPDVRVFMGTVADVDATVQSLMDTLRGKCTIPANASELPPALQALVQAGLQELDTLRTP